jgi:phage gp29-like protein
MNLIPQRLRLAAEELVSRARGRVEQLAWQYASTTSEGQWQLARNRRPDTHEFPDIPVTLWSDWTIQSIKNADNSLVQGQFAHAAILSESMQADDRVGSALNGRIKGVTKCALTMTPAETGDKTQCANVAKELEKLWPEMMPLETIEQIQTWTIFLGFCICELVWELKEKLWVPRIKVWHPLHIYYRVDIRRYIVITMEGTVEIEPNDPKWFLFTPFGSYRGWIAGAAVRSIAIPWVVRGYALRDWSRFCEKHGMPIVIAKMAAAKAGDDKARFFQQLKNLGAETTLSLPEGWDAMLLEAKDTSWEAFERIIAQCDRSITLRIRGTNLTTEVGKAGGGGGSLAAAQTHREEDSDYAEADVKKFGQALKLQVFGPYCLYNHGDARLAPTPVLEAKPQEDKKAKGETLVSVSTAIVSLEQTGWPIDRQKTAEEFGINLKEGAGDGTLNPTTPDQGGDPTGQRPQLPEADEPDQMPGAEGESGDNSEDPTVASRVRLFNENHGPDGRFADGPGGAGKPGPSREQRRSEHHEYARKRLAEAHEHVAETAAELASAKQEIGAAYDQMHQGLLRASAHAKKKATEASALAKKYTAEHRAIEKAGQGDTPEAELAHFTASEYKESANNLKAAAKAADQLALKVAQTKESHLSAADTKAEDKATRQGQDLSERVDSRVAEPIESYGELEHLVHSDPARFWEYHRTGSTSITNVNDPLRLAGEHAKESVGLGDIPEIDSLPSHVEAAAAHGRAKRAASTWERAVKRHAPAASATLSRSAPAQAAQQYIDRVVDAGKAAVVPVLRQRVDQVMAEVRKAGGYEDLKARLARMARDSKRSKLRSAVKDALVLSELVGRHAVQVETE